MTREETKAAIAVMAAWVEGKRVQQYDYSQWKDADNPTWQWHSFGYRIAPEPKLRPWTIDEVPVGKIVKNGKGARYVISGHNPDGVISMAASRFTVEEFLLHWTMDDGSPCGVEVANE